MQRQAHTSRKTHAGAPPVMFDMSHPPLNMKALFRSIGYHTLVRDFSGDDVVPHVKDTFVIEFVNDVTLDLNVFECFRSLEDGGEGSMTLHLHPETRQVVEQLNDDVITKFFDEHGFSIGLVYFDINERLPAIVDMGIRVTAHIRDSIDTFSCHGWQKNSACCDEQACDHMCTKHCSELDPDWKTRVDEERNKRCVCEINRNRILRYDDKKGRIHKRARI
jgi:hypothetical protein